ncbi:hypothetical protein EVAR_35393_1 [Eumeta japonica]|uniref:Uncharacterized protein n=1 Tax=Eumeta variegata TaxID=151549 RepID=A0A4C1XF73_EUMVA|nr:hypothetical protein EVAR_35393_1 [Eumeta japonica]
MSRSPTPGGLIQYLSREGVRSDIYLAEAGRGGKLPNEFLSAVCGTRAGLTRRPRAAAPCGGPVRRARRSHSGARLLSARREEKNIFSRCGARERSGSTLPRGRGEVPVTFFTNGFERAAGISGNTQRHALAQREGKKALRAARAAA